MLSCFQVCFPDESGSIVAISAGDSHSAALSANGHLFFWGGWRDNSGELVLNFSLASDKGKISNLSKDENDDEDDLCKGT